MTPAQLIARKRDGEELSGSSIADFIEQYALGRIPDYQMSALAMAIYFQGMSRAETVSLTRAMLESGVAIQWPEGEVSVVDKHSTGGIGDKVSLVLTPVMACCGLRVPMLSGRGLGITGGTLDKLESIPGLRTDFPISEIQALTERVGCVIAGASDELAPADKKLYALRDVTATVPSIPLIIASVMSKKLAEGLDALVLDVKVGNGAFMKSMDDARRLARGLVDVGTTMAVRTTALITDMNQPLGRCVGNALEVREAIETLEGTGPLDLLNLTLQLGNELLIGEGVVPTAEEGIQLQQRIIDSGAAAAKFWEMIAAQGGQPHAQLEIANGEELPAPKSGFVSSIDTTALGLAVIQLGGGRKVMTDTIDHGVGLEMRVRVGDPIEQGQPLMRVLARPALRVFNRPSPRDFDTSDLLQAVTIDPEPAAPLKLIHERVVPHE